ncbi:flagellar biosynthesis protein FliQ [Wenzhouxiangella limi]|uniref:Flagellar biosynthetic protein FliQ n=1 Tax=Wenzhouxiangella limi TaxID=2707351 RepID=A0A845VJ00_9GAMM|nr:flagellar biosynthesis protein FliQ [Wenzhouxiangella limi]NDY97149.1 flagellar biosynthesis protein FliQ [Wenzhouxiangella limi]
MTPDLVMDIGREALWTIALLLAPLLLSALAAGLTIGMFQAATQINEMTLSFIPKLAVLILAMALAGPFMIDLIVNYMRELVTSIPTLLDLN